MTSAIHNRQAGEGKVITFVTQDVLVNTAGTIVIKLQMRAGCFICVELLIVFKVSPKRRLSLAWQMDRIFIPPHLLELLTV